MSLAAHGSSSHRISSTALAPTSWPASQLQMERGGRRNEWYSIHGLPELIRDVYYLRRELASNRWPHEFEKYLVAFPMMMTMMMMMMMTVTVVVLSPLE